jgi:hypothetical protein
MCTRHCRRPGGAPARVPRWRRHAAVDLRAAAGPRIRWRRPAHRRGAQPRRNVATAGRRRADERVSIRSSRLGSPFTSVVESADASSATSLVKAASPQTFESRRGGSVRCTEPLMASVPADQGWVRAIVPVSTGNPRRGEAGIATEPRPTSQHAAPNVTRATQRPGPLRAGADACFAARAPSTLTVTP